MPAPLGMGAAPPSQAALVAQVHDMLGAVVARRPLMLLDDLHWADPASLALLRVLARQVATLAMLLVVTYWSDEVSRRHPLAQVLPTLDESALYALLCPPCRSRVASTTPMRKPRSTTEMNFSASTGGDDERGRG